MVTLKYEYVGIETIVLPLVILCSIFLPSLDKFEEICFHLNVTKISYSFHQCQHILSASTLFSLL